jgi:hypothetical protein
MAKVWEVEIKQEPQKREIIIKPTQLTEIKELKSRKDPNWQNPQEAPKLVGIVGGGVIEVVEEDGVRRIVTVQRDANAPRALLAIDALAGIGDASIMDETLKPRYPTIPLIYNLLCEMTEVLIQQEGIFVIPIPRNIPKQFRYLFSSAAHASIDLLFKPPFTIYEDLNAEIGKFSEGWTIKEIISEDQTKYRGLAVYDTQITYEPEEKSLEIILPSEVYIKKSKRFGILDLGTLKVKVKAGGRLAFYDGEHSGEPNYHDTSIDLRNVNPLNRFVLLFDPDGNVTVYKRGEMIVKDIPFQEYVDLKIHTSNHPPLSQKSPFSIRDAIKEGVTTGYTSKIKLLGSLYEKGISMKFEDGEASLKPLNIAINILEEINKERDPKKEFPNLVRGKDTQKIKS